MVALPALDHSEPTGRIGWIGIIFFDDRDNADNPLFVYRMIEESFVAFLHGFHVICRLIIADAVPFRDTIAYLIFPRPCTRF